MDYKDILYTVEDGITTLTLNRPETLNAITPRMHGECADAIQHARTDDGAKVLVITGAGRAFCAGANPRRLADQRGEEPQDRSLHAIAEALQEFHKPFIGAINGPAAGGGMDIASLCDIRLASEEARFSMAYVRMGVIPAQGGLYLLPRIVGIARALDLVWTGRTIDAQEALGIGYVQAVYPHQEFAQRVQEYCSRMAKGPSLAINAAKRLLYQGLHQDNLLEALRVSDQAMEVLAATEDAKEGPRAWLEKRPPRFQGR